MISHVTRDQGSHTNAVSADAISHADKVETFSFNPEPTATEAFCAQHRRRWLRVKRFSRNRAKYAFILLRQRAIEERRKTD